MAGNKKPKFDPKYAMSIPILVANVLSYAGNHILAMTIFIINLYRQESSFKLFEQSQTMNMQNMQQYNYPSQTLKLFNLL